jgi:hypothetical protein
MIKTFYRKQICKQKVKKVHEIPCHKRMWLNLPPKFLPNIFVTPLMHYMGFFFIHVVISKCQIKKNKVYCTNCDFLSCDLLSYLSKIESFVNFWLFKYFDLTFHCNIMWLNLPPKFLPNIFVTPLMHYMGFFLSTSVLYLPMVHQTEFAVVYM